MRQAPGAIPVGRDDEVKLFAGALKAVGAGYGGAVFVLVEARIGKSRLVSCA
jgi:predicted ATPase